MKRYEWTDEELAATLKRLLTDEAMHARLAEVSAHMRGADGVAKAADIILEVAEAGIR
jgi:UDP:flavonoid glycosyltransferase YjiC (YdhE family)